MIGVVDETAPADRGGIYYVVTATVVLDTDATRLSLRSVLPEGRKRPFHWADERPEARARMLDLLVSHGPVAHVVVHYPTARRRQEHARRAAFQELVPLAVADGFQELIIESRATHEDGRDRRALVETVRDSGATLSYRWADKSEPLLWLATPSAASPRSTCSPRTRRHSTGSAPLGCSATCATAGRPHMREPRLPT